MCKCENWIYILKSYFGVDRLILNDKSDITQWFDFRIMGNVNSVLSLTVNNENWKSNKCVFIINKAC